MRQSPHSWANHPHHIAGVAVIFILMAGFALRIYQLDEVSLRGDEAFSAQYWAGIPLEQSLREIATIEPHPPLTYVLFHLWGGLNGIDNVFVLRFLPALVSVAAIATMYRMAHRATGHTTAIIATALIAFHPYLLWHAQDFRNYAIWHSLHGLAGWLILLAPDNPHKGWRWSILLITTSTTLFFYFEVLFLLALLIYRWFQARRYRIVWATLLLPGVVLSGLTFLILQGPLIVSGGYGGNIARFSPNLLASLLATLTTGDNLPPEWLSWSGMFIGAMLILGLLWMRRTQPQTALFLIFTLGLPVLALSLISLRFGIYHPRYILPATFYIVVTIGWLIDQLWRTTKLRWISIILSISIFGLYGVSLNNYFANVTYRKSPDWLQITDFIKTFASSQTVVVQTGLDAAFGYYYDRHTTELAIPTSPSQSTADIESNLSGLLSEYDEVWVSGRTPPDWPNSGVVETFLATGSQTIFTRRISGVPVTLHMPLRTLASDTYFETPVSLGNSHKIYGFRLIGDANSEMLIVVVSWSIAEDDDTPVTSFIHLVNPSQINPATGTPLWSQDDHPIQRTYVVTGTQGSLYRDAYMLNLRDIPTGEYEIVAGLYDVNGIRLRTTDDRDHVFLSNLERQ